MGTTLPDSKENLNGAKNGVTRRNMLRAGLWSALMGILGSQTVLSQDNAVAVVTNPQNVPGRSLETVAPQSWFATTIIWLQTEIAALQEEFKKWNIDSKKMEELLTKLLLNEKTITAEVQKAIDVIRDKLGKTYNTLSPSDKKREKIKEFWDLLLSIKTELSSGSNLIKGLRMICDMSWNPDFHNETSQINRSYFRNIVEYIDTICKWIIGSIDKYELSFNAQPSHRIKELKESIKWLQEKLTTDDIWNNSGTHIVQLKTKEQWWEIVQNTSFGKLSRGNLEIKDGVMTASAQGWVDCHAGYAEIKIPDWSKRINVRYKLIENKVTKGKLTPICLIYESWTGAVLGTNPVEESKKTWLTIPKWAQVVKIYFGVVREKAEGKISFSNVELGFK